MVIALATSFASVQIQNYYTRPSVTIQGVRPIHLYSSRDFGQFGSFRQHSLAFIIKLTNESPSATLVPVVLIDGCIVGGLMAQAAHMDRGTHDEVLPRSQKTKVRISLSAQPNNTLVAGSATSYVGVHYPLRGGRTGVAYGDVTASTTEEGHCLDVQHPVTEPTVLDLFAGPDLPTANPEKLRPEFYNGKLEIYLELGTTRITVDPTLLRDLVSIPRTVWQDLSFSAAYESPNTIFPQRKPNPQD